MKVAIIDCFDSFTYNLYQLVGSLGGEPVPITCDQQVEVVERAKPDRIILSPGPGTPDDTGVCKEVIRRYAGEIPILGVCLGHQTIIQTFGGTIIRMKSPVHGKTSEILHSGIGVFGGIKTPITATRYHSLTAQPQNLPSSLEVTATAADDGTIMAVSHKKYPVYGLQFHPESIMTPKGRQIMANFLKATGEC
jgi:anthranilate synthase component II